MSIGPEIFMKYDSAERDVARTTPCLDQSGQSVMGIQIYSPGHQTLGHFSQVLLRGPFRSTLVRSRGCDDPSACNFSALEHYCKGV